MENPTNIKSWCLVLLMLVTFGLEGALAATQAGEVSALRGTAWAKSAGEEFRSLEKGAKVFSGDRVKTGKRSFLTLQFTDESEFYVGPQAEMSIDDFTYKSPDKESSFTTSISKGVFRFVSGLIAKEQPQAMRVQLPVATIGIRGTNVTGEASATSATVILLEPEGEARPTSVEVANNFGSVVIDEPGFGTEIPDEHSPPSPPRRMGLRTINNLMRSLRSIRPQVRMRP